MKITASAAALLAALVLTGCGSTGNDSAVPSSGPTPSSEATTTRATVSAAPTRTAEPDLSAERIAEERLITGDIYQDVAAAGFVPRDYPMDVAIADIEEDICLSDMDPTAIGGSEFNRNVRMATLNDSMGPDPLRVVAYYKCQSRAAYLELSIETAIEDFG